MSKKIFFLFLLFCNVYTCRAVKLTYGSLDFLRNEKAVQVVLDLSNTTYNKAYSIDRFIDKAYRIDSWESESTRAFVSQFTEKTGEYGLKATLPGKVKNIKYEIQVAPKNVSKDGCFGNTVVSFIEISSKRTMAVIEVYISDCDDNDPITFKDQMLEAGEKIGKFVKSRIK